MEISVFVMVVDDGALSLSIMLVICNPAAYPYYLCFDDYYHYPCMCKQSVFEVDSFYFAHMYIRHANEHSQILDLWGHAYDPTVNTYSKDPIS